MEKNLKNNSYRGQGKRKILFPLLLLGVLLMINLVSADWDWDNVKSNITIEKDKPLTIGDKELNYTDIWETYKPIRVKNALGLGEVLFEGAITKHTSTCYSDCESIMTIELTNPETLVKDIRFRKLIDEKWVDIDFKDYTIYMSNKDETYEKTIWELQCWDAELENKTKYTECDNIKIGTETITRPIWKPITLNEQVEAGTYQVKIEGKFDKFLWTKEQEIWDWQIYTAGEWMTSWAYWTVGLDTGLLSYYKLDNNNFTDEVNDFDLTDDSTTNTTGKLIDGREFTGSSSSLERVNTSLIGTVARSFNMWVYSDDTANYRDFLMYGTEASNALFHWRQNNNGKIWIQNQGTSLEANVTIPQDTWVMVTATFDGTTARIYQNATLVGEANIPFNTGVTNGLYFGSYKDTAEWWDGKMDEIGIWNRSLTQEEITLLYNEGAGLPFQEYESGISVTLNYPPADTQTGVMTTTFNCSATATNSNVTNISLWLNSTGAWAENETKTVTGISNSSVFTKTFVDGDTINWNCKACNSNGTCNYAINNRTIHYAVSLLNTTLNSPINNFNSTDSTQVFNCSTIADVNKTVMNISLWTNTTGTWGLNETRTQFGYCYQETANISTSCGGLSTGIYDLTTQNYIYINYTKPENSMSTSKWQVKYGVNGSIGSSPYFYNASIDETCWNYNDDTLILRFYFRATPSGGGYTGASWGECYNGNWINITIESISPFAVDTTQVSNLIKLYDGNYNTYATASSITGNPTEPTVLGGVIDYGLLWEEAIYWDMGSDGLFTKILPDGRFIWNCQGCDNEGNCDFALSNYSLLTDSTLPTGNLISPTNNTLLNSSLNNFTVNASDNIGLNNVTLYITKGTKTCYQESANVSNQTGIDGSCGLNYSGIITALKLRAIYVNYTKPSSALNATWRVKHGVLSQYDITIPNTCYNYNPNQIELYMYSHTETGLQTSELYCNNETWTLVGNNTVYTYYSGGGNNNIDHWLRAVDGDWDTQVLQRNDDVWTYTTSSSQAQLFEEAIVWEVTNIINQTTIPLPTNPISTITGVEVNLTSDGNYTWYYELLDIPRNSFITDNYFFTFDINSPLIDYVSPPTPTNDSVLGNTALLVMVNVTETNLQNVTLRVYDENNSLFATEINSTPTGNLYNLTANLIDGIYYYNVTAVDIANNQNSTQTRKVIIDTTAPIINITSGEGILGYGLLNSNHTINFTITDLNLSQCWYLLNENTTLQINSFESGNDNWILTKANRTNLWASVGLYSLNFTDLDTGDLTEAYLHNVNLNQINNIIFDYNVSSSSNDGIYLYLCNNGTTIWNSSCISLTSISGVTTTGTIYKDLSAYTGYKTLLFRDNLCFSGCGGAYNNYTFMDNIRFRGGVKTLFNCSDGYANFNITQISDEAILYANDTSGNTASQFVEWNFKLLENNRNYITPVLSGTSNPFEINISYNSSFSGISVMLNYNGTNYSMSSSDSGFTRNYLGYAEAPIFTTASTVSFYYIVILANSTGTYPISTTSSTQTVNPFLIDNCTTNGNVLLDMKMYNEETLLEINGTIEVLVNIYSTSRNLVATYNKSLTHTEPTSSKICINQTGTYSLDYTLKHYGNETIYFKKYRAMQNDTITNSSYTKNLSLYNLLIASGYAFRIVVTGYNQDDLLVSVEKQYIPFADFWLVESQTTNSDDETIAHLIPQDSVYNFIVSYMGTVIQNFSNYQATCQNPTIGQCLIILTVGASRTPSTNYNDYLNVSLYNYLNQTSAELTTTFVSTDGDSHEVRQLVIKNSGYSNETICNSSTTGTTGTLICDITATYQNSSYILKTYVDGELRGSAIFTHGVDPDWFGADVLIELLLYSSLVLMMLPHPITIVIGAMLGIICAIGLIFLSSGSFSSIMSTLIFFVIGGGIIIWQIAKKV
jgi:hypothetical protein